MRHASLALVLLIAAAACGDKQAPPPDLPPAPRPVPGAIKPAMAEMSASYIRRPMLEAVLRQGPAWIFERVPVEEVMTKGKFVGWRVRELPHEWRDIDLRPGDVVTKVNAMSLETPKDFWSAWTTLTVASELKIAYLRDGEPREMSYPIEGTPNPELASRMKAPPPAAGAQGPPDSPVPGNQSYNAPRQKKTIIIKSNERPLSDTVVDWSQ